MREVFLAEFTIIKTEREGEGEGRGRKGEGKGRGGGRGKGREERAVERFKLNEVIS